MKTPHSLLGLFVACLLCGCGSSNSKQVQLEFWAIGSEGEVLREMLPRFHAEHPEIRVQLQQIPWSAAHEKLLTAFVGRATPDLCQLGNTWIPEFTMLGALDDLTERQQASAAIPREDYFPGIWATNEIDGRLHGIPWYVDTRVLFYRHDLLAKAGWETPPRTWEEWQAAMRALRDVIGSNGYPILAPTNEWEQIVILGLQMKEPLLRDGNQYGGFRGAAFRRAFEFHTGLFAQALAPIVANTEIANVWLELARGRFAMYVTGPWNIGEFRRRMSPETLKLWSTAALPAPDASWPGASMAGGCSLVLFADSRKKEAAWRLLEYLADPATQAEFFRRSGNLPARQSAWSQTELASDPWAKAFRDQLGHVRPTPLVPEWEQIATRTLEVTDQVIRGQLSVDEGLESLDRRVDSILAKRRWLLSRTLPARGATP